MMNDNSKIRLAGLNDIDFIVEAIIEAEKSGTDHCGFSTSFGLSEEETKSYLRGMLEEEIDGCEFSLDSFLIYEIDGTPVAAVAGWIEGDNSSDQPSSILKSNLIGYYLPKKNIEVAASLSQYINDLQIERTKGTLQIEYVYCRADYRGKGITKSLIQSHINKFNVEFAEVQVFGNNENAMALYQKLGFIVKSESVSNLPDIIDYFPSNKKILFNKKIN